MSTQFHVRSTEFEASGGSDGLTIEGYAAVFRRTASVVDHLGSYTEEVLPGAFQRSLQQRGAPKVKMQWDHGHDPAVGSMSVGVWEQISEDGKGLYVRGRIMDTARTADLRAGIEMGAITGMSFRFGVPKHGEKWDQKRNHRQLTEVALIEAGPVQWEAYEETEVALRSQMVDLWRAALSGAIDLSELRGMIQNEVEAAGPDAGTRDDPTKVVEAGRPDVITLAEMRQRALVLRGVIPNVQEAGISSRSAG